MAKQVNWYLLGWKRRRETAPSGRSISLWTYEGDYFSPGMAGVQLRRFKRLCLLLGVLTVVLWFVLSAVDTLGKNIAAYVGAPWFLGLLPLMELILGLRYVPGICEKMTYRDMYGAYRRMLYGLYILLPLELLSAVGEVGFLCRYHGYIAVLPEVFWLAGVMACAACAGGLLILLRRNMPRVIPKE